MLKNSENDLQEIDAATLRQWLNAEKVLLVDVRESGEYASERIRGAKLIPLSQFNPNRIEAIADKPIVLYCQSGNRSRKAGQRLLEAGVTPVIHLKGGLPAWKQAGYPVEADKNAPIPIMRQVQIVAGSLVFAGTVLGAFVSPWFLLLSGFVGAGLVFAGVSGTCALGSLLAKLPYNQRPA